MPKNVANDIKVGWLQGIAEPKQLRNQIPTLQKDQRTFHYKVIESEMPTGRDISSNSTI